MKQNLLHFLHGSNAPLKIMTIESTLYLPELRKLFPNASLYGVTEYNDVPDIPEYRDLGVEWVILDYRKRELPFARKFFDYVISECCMESAYEPYDSLMSIGRLIKDNGHLLTKFSNVCYHGVLENLQQGRFLVGELHFYTKKEVVRLLDDTLYKEILFSPFEQDDDKSAGEVWEKLGFDNYSDDLSTAAWMVKASRSTAGVAALKELYSPELRKKISRILHRIEFDVERDKNLAELWEICQREMIFGAYIAGFVEEVVIHKEKVRAILKESARNNGLEDIAEEI